MYTIAAIALLIALAAFLYLNSIQNSSSGSAQQLINPNDYQTRFVKAQRPHLLLDVRTPEEFATGRIPGALNIAVQDLAGRLNELPKDQPIVVYCRSGNRSKTAMQILSRAGYSELYDLGGIMQWQAQGLPLQ